MLLFLIKLFIFSSDITRWGKYSEVDRFSGCHWRTIKLVRKYGDEKKDILRSLLE